MNLRIENRPRSRGVTHLMYVGDDEAVEKAVDRSSAATALGIAALAYAALGPRRHRGIAGAVALASLLAR